MKITPTDQHDSSRATQRGFTIVELLVAVAIGLLLLGGIGSLFLGTSRTNSFQERLARVQENGRFATQRMASDLQNSAGLYCSSFTGSTHAGTTGYQLSRRPIMVHAPSLDLPDSGGMRSVDLGTGAAQSAVATGTVYGLSPRFFMQGYQCTGAVCTPALPGEFPAAALAAESRVPNTDVLTVRYLRGTGWAVSNSSSCETTNQLTIEPRAGDDPINFSASGNQLAYVSDCNTPGLFPVVGAAGNTLTLGTMLPLLSGVQRVCQRNDARDVRLFNFSQDFVTISYFLMFRADDNPDALPNAGGQRLVPVLIRRENGVNQELVRGVDDLRFLYSVRDRFGVTRFLNAAQVNNRLGGTINCPFKADFIAPGLNDPLGQEPGCLWRSVTGIEARLLVNSVDDLGALENSARAYSFNGSLQSPTAATLLPSGVSHGNKLRKEFIAHVATKGVAH